EGEQRHNRAANVGKRMQEPEPRSVQKLAVEAEHVRAPIQWITGHREIDGAKMDADLVRAARLEAHVEQRMARQEIDDLEVRHGLAWTVRRERLAKRVTPVASDRRLDPPPARARTP